MRRRFRLATGLIGGVAIAIAAGLAVTAQPSDNESSSSGGASSSSSDVPPGVPVIQAPPEVTPPDKSASEDNSDNQDNGKKPPPTNSLAAKPAAPPPAAGPKPVRSPAAVLQALDKVTAETMRFAAKVGQPVRYKNLVFVVKACESTGLGGPSPQESAYVVIDFAPLGAEGIAAPPARQVFKGWMFANSPGLNPFQHPTYDAWLITCMAAAPPA
ncbi:MAG TPA: DUF2155 domain-containing protein [Caulobacteraceae bacterium]|nr:DUF2155 domain-containing protein [Caulobacteraceae bacterium]